MNPATMEKAASEARRESRWGFEEGDEIAPGRHALKRLGGGHRYEAYLAWDDRLHAVVVVKVLRPHVAEDAHAREGLAAEAEMLGRLNHPVLLRSFGATLEGQRPQLVLEHLEGPRLSTLVRRYGPLPVEQLVPLALQICSAIHYLRAEEVVHLDIKPSNVIMSAPPRLIDFSVARSSESARSLRQPIGTDAYMAPEQCDPVGRGGVGAEADVWGTGVTLYRAATGERPFSSPRPETGVPEERWPQLVEEPAPLEGRLPANLADPIMRCLVEAPAARPTPVAIAGALEPVLAALPKPRLSRLKPRIRS
jgi:eukaryotic-like serine/threonine-protein kinase